MTFNVTIVFSNCCQTLIKDAHAYGYRDAVFYVEKDSFSSFIPQDKILYIGVEEIQLENIVIKD
jgi:hypothetical protein